MTDTPLEVPAARASPARVVCGKGSGLPSVVGALEALGISVADEDMREILAAIKPRALETKSPLPFEEVARIVAKLLGARAAEPVA
jgi:hypothetical protein